MNTAAARAFPYIAAACLAACTQRTEVEVDTPAPGLEFRLVQYERPGYNVSYEHIVFCRSRYTGSAPRADGVPSGAALVARLDSDDVLWLNPRGAAGLDQALAAARNALRTGSGWMAIQQRNALRVTADRCRSFVAFVPAKHLDPRHVERSPGYVCDDPRCVESGLAGHRWQYRDLELTLGAEPAKSRMKFVMESPALVHRAGLELATEDGGNTWRAKPREGPGPAAPFEPSPGRYLGERR